MNGKQAKRCRRIAHEQATAPSMKRGERWVRQSWHWWYKRLKRGVSRKMIPPFPYVPIKKRPMVIFDDIATTYPTKPDTNRTGRV